jgi:hypothetical protein
VFDTMLEIQAAIGVSQPISHAADIAPGLAGHEFCRAPAQTMCGFADPFQAALDGITRLSVALKRLPIYAEQTCRSMPSR